MINLVANKYGQSFKGLNAYLSHDKLEDQKLAQGKDFDPKRQTSNRVSTSGTLNLATNDPAVGWKIMAAHAMDRERLKAEAGMSKVGRKAKGPVQHIVFAWHPEEGETLSENDMRRAAISALKAVKMDNHFACWYVHTDEPQPHIHIEVSRVHPKTGAMVNPYNDYKKLSRWANKYEKQRGKVYCKNRDLNEQKRKLQERKRQDARKAVRDDNPSRTMHLLETTAVNDNRQKDALIEEQRNRARALFERQEKQVKDQAAAIRGLEIGHRQQVQQINQARTVEIRTAVKKIDQAYRSENRALKKKHQREEKQFKKSESKAVGRAMNAFKSIDFKGLMSLYDRHKQGDGRAVTMKAVFKVMGNASDRLKVLADRQNFERLEITKRMDRDEKQAIKVADERRKASLSQARKNYLGKRSTLRIGQQLERKAISKLWRDHSAYFNAQWDKIRVVSKEIKSKLSRDEAYQQKKADMLKLMAEEAKESYSHKRGRKR